MAVNHLIEISNKNIRLILSNLGASIYAIYYKGVLMTQTTVDDKDFLKDSCYYGKTVGDFTNRVKDGTLKIGDKEFYYPLNEPSSALHGGVNNLSKVFFKDCVYQDKVVFHTKREKYIPFITYQLKDDSISIQFNYDVLEDLPLSTTNHAFFNLGDSDNSKLILSFESKKMISVDEALIPQRYIDNPYGNTILLKDQNIDNCFKLDSRYIYLENAKYQLKIETNFHYVQIYTDNFIDGIKCLNTDKDNHRSVAIEPQDDILNRKLIKKDTSYERYITLYFNENN